MNQEIGFFYTVYKEKRAIEYSLEQLRMHYPYAPIYMVSDGGLDFSYLEAQYSNMKTVYEEDTMSNTFKITGAPNGNWKEETHQKVIQKAAKSVLNRLYNAISYLQTDYILMLDPDALVRGKLTIPSGAKLLGSRINKGFPKEYKDILANTEGALIIDEWGATPCIFEVKSFLKAYNFINEHLDIFDQFCLSFYAMYAHDVLLPTLFALIGIEETFNPDIIECQRDSQWRNKSNPLVHQFKYYY